MSSNKAIDSQDNRSFDETVNLIPPTILRQKALQLSKYIQEKEWPNGFQPFKEHTEDVVRRVIWYLDMYDKTRRPVLKDLCLFLANGCLNLFLFQYHLFKSAERDSSSDMWSALKHFAYYLSDKLELVKKPLPVLGATYYSSGSPSYREYGLILRPYYVIVADSLDSPLFWPLIAHELAHCKLSETEHIKRLLEIATRLNLNLTREIERRIEEALCDLIATRLMGPAFVYAYCLKLYPTFYGDSVPEEYPLDQFRLECMCSVLDSAGLTEVANEVRIMRDTKFIRNWTEEKLTPLKEDLIKLSADFDTLFMDVSERNVSTYVDYWDKFVSESAERSLDLLKELSTRLIQMLKGPTTSSDSSAQFGR